MTSQKPLCLVSDEDDGSRISAVNLIHFTTGSTATRRPGGGPTGADTG